MTETTDPANQNWRGRNAGMDRMELEVFFAGGVISRLATVDERSWPYVVPVWFEYDPSDGGFWIIERKQSVWCEHIRRNGRVGLSMDETGAPNRRAVVQGIAEIVEDANVGGRWVAIGERMARRYLGPKGPDYLVPTLDKPRILVKVRPERMMTWQGVDWHPRYQDA